MKTFAIVFALCFVIVLGGLTEKQKEKLAEHKSNCITENGVTKEAVEKAYRGEWDEGNENLQCFTSCMLKKIGVMDDNGTFNEETARSKLAILDIPTDKIEKIMTTCKDFKGKTACETGLKYMQCYTEEKKKLALM